MALTHESIARKKYRAPSLAAGGLCHVSSGGKCFENYSSNIVCAQQKQDEKYLLKFHTGSGGAVPGTSRDEVKKILSPVIKFTTMLVSDIC